jgi:hypothetical protein
MKRPKTHETDSAAQRIFESALPREWVPRKENPDYGLDYTVEVFDQQEQTGLRFGVQLKGTARLEKGQRHVSYPISTQHLVEYLDKERLPVFLVVVDVGSKQGYWVFLQEHALTHLRRKDWRRRKSVTVHLPRSNTLRAHQRLRTAVEAADRFMAELRPSSIESAVKATRLRHESLDPRFSIGITVTDGQTRYELRARQRVEGTFTIEGQEDEIVPKVRDMIDRGIPVTFAPGQVEASGSRLLAEILKEATTLQWSRSFEATICVTAVDSSGAELARLDGIQGRFTGGTKELRFDGGLPSAPLGLEFTLRTDEIGTTKSLVIGYRFDLAAWRGQPIRQLAYFDQIASLFLAMTKAEALRFQCSVRGNLWFSVTSRRGQLEELLRLVPLLDLLSKARRVARHFGVDPLLPADLSQGDVKEIEDLNWLLNSGEPPRAGLGYALDACMMPNEARKLLQTPMGMDGTREGPLRFSGSREPFPFLRQRVDVGPIELTLTYPTLSVDRAGLEQLLHEGHETISVSWKGTAKSRASVRILPGENRGPRQLGKPASSQGTPEVPAERK